MDKIPKFRRRPKPPTIETALERPSSSDTADSTELPTVKKKPSALRSFKLRGTAKRPRESPPPELPLSPAVVHHDSLAGPLSPHPPPLPHVAAGQDDDVRRRNGRDRSTAPAFLAQSSLDIEDKFHEITWSERERVAEGIKNEAVADHKWGFFKLPDPKVRNTMDRYSNIKPWNHNRVRLRVPESKLDYVNASTVVLTSSDKERPPLRYIAMQGPTEPSFSYVWRMVSEQLPSPAVIVQLTTMMEGGNVKCHQYFPHTDENNTWILNQDDVWGDGWAATLKYDSYESLAAGAIERRKLLLHVNGESEPRVIWHLLYRRWPDFGVPTLDDLDSFFHLMKLSRDHTEPHSPRVVHCSAGVGRTGTFIALEHLVHELEIGALESYKGPKGEDDEPPDPVFDTVESLRQQRRGMVQGEVQYKFIYQVLRKLWQDKYGGDLDGQPAAKRLEVSDPFFDSNPASDIGAMNDSASR